MSCWCCCVDLERVGAFKHARVDARTWRQAGRQALNCEIECKAASALSVQPLCERKFVERPDWNAVPPPHRTVGHCSLAFVMLSAGLCSSERLCFKVCRSPVFLLFLLIAVGIPQRRELAEKILSIPQCLLGHFVRRFLSRYNSIDKLVAEETIAILSALGQLVRRDICAVGCRHAVVRRLVKASGDTWQALLEIESARFLLKRGAALWSYLPRRSRKQHVKPKAKVKKFRKQGKGKKQQKKQQAGSFMFVSSRNATCVR